MRNEYQKSLIFNNRIINTIIIDQHYKISHPEITDELILSLIDVISGERFDPESVKGEFEYYKVDPLYYLDKPYRLIFLLCLSDDYLGVINAFRVKGDSNEK
jgi:hypothetical protein